MIERTIEIEKKYSGTPSLLDLFKGVDLRRTLITCLIYASQNFAGNLIANQATYFFERKSLFAHDAGSCTTDTASRGWHDSRFLIPA